MSFTYQNIFIALTLIIIVSIIFLAIRNGSLTSCKNYIMNVYLYIALSYLLTRLFIYLYDQITIPETSMIFLIDLIIVLVCLLIMTFVKKPIIIYPIYLILLASVAFLLRPIFYYKHLDKTVNDGIIQTVILLLLMSIISIYFSNFLERYSNFILTGLFISLISIVIISVWNIIYNEQDLKEFLTVDKIITYLSVIIFAIFIAYDSHRIRKDAMKCLKANYPKASLNIYVDFIYMLNNF